MITPVVPTARVARLSPVVVAGLILGVSPSIAGPTDQPCGVAAREPRECTVVEQSFQTRSLWSPNLWPSGLVPYEYDANVTASQKRAMRHAMDTLQGVCNVRFVDRSPSQQNFLHIENSGSNNAAVGMIGGSQAVSIFNWDRRFIMCHELMHALGVLHEQSRSDRLQYVQINLSNVCQSCCGSPTPGPCDHNFNIVSGATPVGPYDFDSVMHYSGTAFSANGQATIEALPPYEVWQGRMGQRTHLSDGDIAGLVSRYGPAKWRVEVLPRPPGYLPIGNGEVALVGISDDGRVLRNFQSASTFRVHAAVWMDRSWWFLPRSFGDSANGVGITPGGLVFGGSEWLESCRGGGYWNFDSLMQQWRWNPIAVAFDINGTPIDRAKVVTGFNDRGMGVGSPGGGGTGSPCSNGAFGVSGQYISTFNFPGIYTGIGATITDATARARVVNRSGRGIASTLWNFVNQDTHVFNSDGSLYYTAVNSAFAGPTILDINDHNQILRSDGLIVRNGFIVGAAPTSIGLGTFRKLNNSGQILTTSQFFDGVATFTVQSIVPTTLGYSLVVGCGLNDRGQIAAVGFRSAAPGDGDMLILSPPTTPGGIKSPKFIDWLASWRPWSFFEPNIAPLAQTSLLGPTPPGEPDNWVAVFNQGTPAVISQRVDMFAGGAAVQARYRFVSSGTPALGVPRASVTLLANGQPFAFALAPEGGMTEFECLSGSIPASLHGREGVELAVRVDGPQDLVLQLDSVDFGVGILSGPENASPRVGVPMVFEVLAEAIDSLEYQWQVSESDDGVWLALSDGPLVIRGDLWGNVAGSQTLSCVFENGTGATNIKARCVISNSCGSAVSGSAKLTICPADFNFSGSITVQDIFDFLAGWFASAPDADFNGNTGINIQDIFDFLAAWFAGC